MIALVRHEIARIFGRRREANCSEVLSRRRKRWVERRRVAFVGAVDRRRHNDARVEINRVLRFVREMRLAVLHLGDLRVRIGLARPILVRQPLAFALAVKLDEVIDRRRLDAALLRHPRQHLAIGLATVVHDRPQRGVGLHRRSVDADPLALHETALGNELQNEFEHLLVNFIWQSAACLRQSGMVGNLVSAPKSQEIPKRPCIRAEPDNAALAGETFEIANHMHAEIAARRQRRCAHLWRIEWLAGLFDESVKPSLRQQFLQAIVEHVSRRARHLSPCHEEVALKLTFTPHRHRCHPFRIFNLHTESGKPNFVNGLVRFSAPIVPKCFTGGDDPLSTELKLPQCNKTWLGWWPRSRLRPGSCGRLRSWLWPGWSASRLGLAGHGARSLWLWVGARDGTSAEVGVA